MGIIVVLGFGHSFGWQALWAAPSYFRWCGSGLLPAMPEKSALQRPAPDTRLVARSGHHTIPLCSSSYRLCGAALSGCWSLGPGSLDFGPLGDPPWYNHAGSACRCAYTCYPCSGHGGGGGEIHVLDPGVVNLPAAAIRSGLILAMSPGCLLNLCIITSFSQPTMLMAKLFCLSTWRILEMGVGTLIPAKLRSSSVGYLVGFCGSLASANRADWRVREWQWSFWLFSPTGNVDHG